MTNKDLAVQLYAARLQAMATAFSRPNARPDLAFHIPTDLEMIEDVESLAQKLSMMRDY